MHLAKTASALRSRPAMLPVAEPQLSQRQVVLRAGVCWIALNRCFVRAQRLLHPSQVQQGIAAIRCRAAIAQRLGPREMPPPPPQIAPRRATRCLPYLPPRHDRAGAPAPSAAIATRRPGRAPRRETGTTQSMSPLAMGSARMPCADISPPRPAACARAQAAPGSPSPETRSGRSSTARRRAASA